MTKENQSKILVIDDDETILMQVEKILENNGYSIVCADNGKSGLEKAISEQPDLILLDRNMPKMDGDETLSQLKANEEVKDTPVIMLTGDNQITNVSTSFKLGAIDYIVKPFDQDNFIIRVKKALQKIKKD